MHDPNLSLRRQAHEQLEMGERVWICETFYSGLVTR